MECLGIPIDHRLRHVIRNARPTYTDIGDSGHVQILKDFGDSLKVKCGDYLSTNDLSFGLEMARPASKGGLVIALLRPHSTQDNSHGFLAGKRQCRTIDAISDLICAVSNARKGFDDISVFDAIPFLDEHVTAQDIIQTAEHVFIEMLRAKQPDVVISCFKADTSNVIIQSFSCRSLGFSFEFDPQGSDLLVESGFSLSRVNAFHPSYSINYHPEICCFKQLLVLEFTKAFALQQQSWKEEPWMAHLRYECCEQAKKVAKSKYCAIIYNLKVLAYLNTIVDKNKGCWKADHLKYLWEGLLTALKAAFERCFFSGSGFRLANCNWYMLVQSKITWICCDIAQLLEQAPLEVPELRILLDGFRSWCRKAWPKISRQRNLDGTPGYYVHTTLLLLKSEQRGTRAKKFENKFYNFLRDLNLSYSWLDKDKVKFARISAQANAFRRLAVAFEGILEEGLEATQQEQADIDCRMDAMNMGPQGHDSRL
ncbi:unnamed protein product [Penicillium salamii]|uniref:Uncharacterized protein n=1 Tax=Penicillium salamii TaxID=1612424 RepID=A0A9W4NXC7_9EURO|nr:unnamed protein product [Penicillium salamii]CAG7936568.1 unnamed protein product [Penicillium salamii]CAG7958012.1 unnamed protein product [Penicillium salamii]CAG7971704.1 unnamed protein product [Penicillium salamii]CAG7977182.1 unnamed protein product [Penicillium salamii]